MWMRMRNEDEMEGGGSNEDEMEDRMRNEDEMKGGGSNEE